MMVSFGYGQISPDSSDFLCYFQNKFKNFIYLKILHNFATYINI